MAFSSVARKRMVVLLPAPLGPMKPNISPGADLQAEVIDRQQVAVTFGEIQEFDHSLFLVFTSGRGASPKP